MSWQCHEKLELRAGLHFDLEWNSIKILWKMVWMRVGPAGGRGSWGLDGWRSARSTERAVSVLGAAWVLWTWGCCQRWFAWTCNSLSETFWFLWVQIYFFGFWYVARNKFWMLGVSVIWVSKEKTKRRWNFEKVIRWINIKKYLEVWFILFVSL